MAAQALCRRRRGPRPEIVNKIDYEAWGKITFNTDQALFANGPGRFPVTFFHLGKFFQKAVEMHGRGRRPGARDRLRPGYFHMPAEFARRTQLPEGVGFAGFRVQEPRDGKLDWRKNDWVGVPRRLLFPRHRRALPVRPVGARRRHRRRGGRQGRGIPGLHQVLHRDAGRRAATRIVVYALLDGPSVTGAYRFAMTRGKGVVMDIEQALILRKDVERASASRR